MYNHVYTYVGTHTGIVLYAVDCTQHMIVLCCIIRLVYSLWSEVYLLPETQLCRRGGGVKYTSGDVVSGGEEVK